MSKLRKLRKAQVRLQERIKDWEETTRRIEQSGSSAAGYKKPGSNK